MNYSDSLWSQAPVEATAWLGFSATSPTSHPYWTWWFGDRQSLSAEETYPTAEIHYRPQAYQSPAQLIEAYRKEHGAEVESAVDDLWTEGFDGAPLDHLLDDALFHLVIIEHHLATERARIEGVEK